MQLFAGPARYLCPAFKYVLESHGSLRLSVQLCMLPISFISIQSTINRNRQAHSISVRRQSRLRDAN